MHADWTSEVVSSIGERTGSAVIYVVRALPEPSFVFRIHFPDGRILEFEGGRSEQIAETRARCMLLSYAV